MIMIRLARENAKSKKLGSSIIVIGRVETIIRDRCVGDGGLASVDKASPRVHQAGHGKRS